MRVFYGFENLPLFRHPVVTVGSYDGVHRGHRELLRRINRLALEQQGESVVVTFSPHPRQVLETGPGVSLLSTLAEKIRLLDSVEVDNLIVAPFTKAFSRVSSYDFVKDYMVGKVGVSTLVVGYNHHFGYQKEGDFNYLERLQEQFGFSTYVVPRCDVDDDKVSSTIIRQLIGSGEMQKATHYLGAPYFMIGTVDASRKFMPGDPAKLLPPAGTYPVVAEVEQRRWDDVLSIGAAGELRLANVEENAVEQTAVLTFA